MYVLLNLERRTFLFHFHTDHDIQVFCLGCSLLIVLAILIKLRSISILYEVTSVMTISLLIDTFLNKVIVEFLYQIVLTLEVNHRTGFTFLINKEQTWDMGIFSHFGIIGTEGRRDMHDTGTILCTECLTLHLHKLILTVLARKHLLRMSLSIGLHIIGSISINFS